MLDFLRKNATGPLGIALIILLVFAFSIWGVGDIFRGYNANILAKIGNREVNAENYLFRFNREINRVSNQLNRLVSSVEARNSGLHYQVLDRMIVETTINASGDEINLKASEEALKKRILATNAFKNAFNQFDKNIFDQVLRQNGLTEDSYLAIEGDFHVQEQLSKSIFTNINPPRPLNSLLYKYQFERRNVDYIIISPENDIDLTKISDESSLNFYNKNQNKYLTEETRDFSFISLIISDISSNFDIKNEEVISYYEDNKYDYFEPEKRGYDLVPFTSEKEALNALENYKLTKPSFFSNIDWKVVLTIGIVILTIIIILLIIFNIKLPILSSLFKFSLILKNLILFFFNKSINSITSFILLPNLLKLYTTTPSTLFSFI